MRANQHDARMLSPQAKEALRLRVVHAVVEQQMPPAEAVRVFPRVAHGGLWMGPGVSRGWHAGAAGPRAGTAPSVRGWLVIRQRRR